MQNNVVNKVKNYSENPIVETKAAEKKEDNNNSDVNSKHTLKEKISEIGIIKKIRSIKHIEYIVAVILIAILLIIFFKNFGVKQNTKSDNESTSTSISMTEYSKAVQTELNSVLSKIKGAGSVSSMVTFEAGPEIIPAYSIEQTDEKSEYDEKGNITKKPIVVNGELLILKEMIPVVKGVVIVTKGGDDSRVRFELKKAAMTLLGIGYEQIEVFTMK